MKKIILPLLAAVSFFASCTSMSIPDANESRTEVTFTIDSPCEVSTSDITRATLSEASVTNLYVLVDGALTVSQTSTDSDFGSPTLTLSLGQHSIVFVASTAALTLTDGVFTYTEGKVRDTFGSIVNINVTRGMAAQSVVLQRIVTRLTVKINDAVPANLASVSITQGKGSKSLSASTLTALNAGTTSDVAIPSLYAGISNLSLNVMSFCETLATDGYTQSVTVSFKDASETVFSSMDIASVPMYANRRTTISGQWFSSAQPHAVTCNATWGEDVEIANQ